MKAGRGPKAGPQAERMAWERDEEARWDTVAEKEMGLSGGGMEMTLHFQVEQMGGNDATDSVREARQKSRAQRKKTILLEVHTTLHGHIYFLSLL